MFTSDLLLHFGYLQTENIKSAVPRLTVNARAVEESRHKILSRTEAAKHQTDPIQRGQHEHTEGQHKTAMVCLSNTAVYPTSSTHTHTNRTMHQSDQVIAATDRLIVRLYTSGYST